MDPVTVTHACAGDVCRLCGGDARDAGQAQAMDARATWSQRAMAWITDQPGGSRFTSEDLTAALGLPSGDVGQHRNNATGAVMRAAARAGLIVRVGYVESVRKRSHAAVLSRWERTYPPLLTYTSRDLGW